MRTLSLKSESIVYRNPMPGYVAIAAVTPCLLPLNDKAVLAFYRKGQAFYSADGMLALSRSTDAGETWMEEPPI